MPSFYDQSKIDLLPDSPELLPASIKLSQMTAASPNITIWIMNAPKNSNISSENAISTSNLPHPMITGPTQQKLPSAQPKTISWWDGPASTMTSQCISGTEPSHKLNYCSTYSKAPTSIPNYWQGNNYKDVTTSIEPPEPLQELKPWHISNLTNEAPERTMRQKGGTRDQNKNTTYATQCG